MTETPGQFPLRDANSRILNRSVTIPEVPDAVSAKGRLGGVAPGKLALETLYIAKAMPKNAQANFPMPDWRVIGGQDAQLSEWYSD